MKRSAQRLDFAPKKLPTQRRSQQTFDALVDACTWLLPRLGFAGTTTNHIAARAGVNIASLYEYFPGKDAIVSQVAERLVERVLSRLAEEAQRAASVGEERVVRVWIEAIYETIVRERELVAVFATQVPYTQQLAPVQALGARLLEFSERIRSSAVGLVHPELSRAGLQLLVNLVSSTILQLVLEPPKDIPRRALLAELGARVDEWIRRPPPS